MMRHTRCNLYIFYVRFNKTDRSIILEVRNFDIFHFIKRTVQAAVNKTFNLLQNCFITAQKRISIKS